MCVAARRDVPTDMADGVGTGGGVKPFGQKSKAPQSVGLGGFCCMVSCISMRLPNRVSFPCS